MKGLLRSKSAPLGPVLLLLGLLLLGCPGAALGQPSKAGTSQMPVEILAFEGMVEIVRAGAVDWDPAYTNQVLRPGDRGRTGPRSRVTLRMGDLSVVPIGERSEFLIEAPPPAAKPSTIFTLLKGLAYFFHRGKPTDVEFKSKTAVAAIRGTEFHFAVDEAGRTEVTMFDGTVELRNDVDAILLTSGEAGIAEPGQAPRKTAVVNAINLIQWTLYYPGVLNVDELPLAVAEQSALRESLAAYRQGDLLQALAQYPRERQPASDAEKVYLAAVLLSVGQVAEAEAWLAPLVAGAAASPSDPTPRLAAALRLVVAAVKHQPRPAPFPSAPPTLLATEWLAESYYQQAQAHLSAARDAARWAAQAAPTFGFAWARAAELEFGYGQLKQAQRDLDKALDFTPRNAQALALKGFFLSAENQIHAALAWFDRALAVDSALGNAWLGRGLCRIRLGQLEAGRDDLLVAAAREPQRALLRSYLGKAFSQTGDDRRAAHELELAKSLDPQDPTAWLYSALLNQQRHRLNEAVRDLEQSQERNDHRRVYRSRLLLDQDRAVRGANLARVYQEAGLTDVSAWEAARAVNTDYANYSAHLFLADSYQALRDPRQINLRYETPWLSEYLVANLLAPVGAGVLSPQVTQQEYSRLFERDRVGLATSTEYFSNGDWVQNASHHLREGNSAYGVDLYYRSENGHRPNNELEQLGLSVRFKQQLGPRDSVFLQGIYYEARAGDVAPYYHQAEANLGLRTKEQQEPGILAGWHREWRPGQHTLLLAGRLADRLDLVNPQQGNTSADGLLFTKDATGKIVQVRPMHLDQEYTSQTTLWTAEAQHIVRGGPHTVIGGLRYQTGDFETGNRHALATFVDLNPLFAGRFRQQLEDFGWQTVQSDFERFSVYLYEQWQVARPLLLIGGLSYNWLRSPNNFRFAPLAGGERTDDLLAPKAGLIWTPTARTTLRGGYARSLGGVGFDQSFQLEPTQVAGFNQAWRSLIPESVAGANAASHFDTAGLALEQRVGPSTYLGVSGHWLRSQVERDVGSYEYTLVAPVTLGRGQVRERLDFDELTLQASAHQLVGDRWSFGARYRLSQATLSTRFLDLPLGTDFRAGTTPENDWESVLHQVFLTGRYHHPCGFFGIGEAIWNRQSNHGYTPDRPGDEFWQFNLYAGYRFPRRHAEVRLGLLNLTDQDYRLNPLNLTSHLPRSRTLAASLQFNF